MKWTVRKAHPTTRRIMRIDLAPLEQYVFDRSDRALGRPCPLDMYVFSVVTGPGGMPKPAQAGAGMW